MLEGRTAAAERDGAISTKVKSGYLTIESPPFFFCHGHHLTDPAAVILVLMIPGKGITGHGSGPSEIKKTAPDLSKAAFSPTI